MLHFWSVMERESFVLWDEFVNADVDIILDMVEGLTENEEIEFIMPVQGVYKSASVGRGSVRGYDCEYYVRIDKDYDLFFDRESCNIFLEYCKKWA